MVSKLKNNLLLAAAKFTVCILVLLPILSTMGLGRAQATSLKLVKSITSIVRSGETADLTTGQYGILNDDLLEISLDVSVANLSEDVNVYDEYYKSADPGSVNSCIPISWTVPAVGVTVDHSNPSQVKFNYTPSAAFPGGRFTYLCKITLDQTSSYKLPEILVGQSRIEQGNQTYYGGMPMNEIVVNYDPNTPLLGFAWDPVALLTDCSSFPPKFPSAISSFCYNLNSTTSPIQRMVSQTSINNVKRLETATLLYPDNSIVGDISLKDKLTNFALYGRNLNKSSQPGNDVYGGTWDVKNYTFNPAAQSSYSVDQQIYYEQRIRGLDSEGTDIENTLLTTTKPWRLQTSSTNIGTGSNDINKYPEGKVWRTDIAHTVTFTGVTKYSGVGTIVINANASHEVEIADGAEISPSDSNSFLGIIVRGGNLRFNGNNKIQAAVFVEDGEIISSNVNNIVGIGSFAAKKFNFTGNPYGIRFFYDYRLDSTWPPGFRYFNMPTAKNTAQ